MFVAHQKSSNWKNIFFSAMALFHCHFPVTGNIPIMFKATTYTLSLTHKHPRPCNFLVTQTFWIMNYDSHSATTQSHGEDKVRSLYSTYHPTQPHAGLAGRSYGHTAGSNVRRSLKGLNHPGWLTCLTRAHNVHLLHTEPAATHI